jgi:FixJ family two-component response regulator
VSETPLISVVDDDESVRRSISRLMKSAGFRAKNFASAEDFLSSGRAQDSACLILDVQMPGMGGLQLQRHLGAVGYSIPIIFITGHSDETNQAQAIQAGAVRFLCKPVNEEDLFEGIRLALKCGEDGLTSGRLKRLKT